MQTYKARAIVLRTVKYSENALVVTALTSSHGRQSYFIQGVRSSKGHGSKLALYQPLSAIEFEGIITSQGDLHRMKDVHSSFISTYDIRKSTISLFIAETLYRLIQESEKNEEFFEFMWESVKYLTTTRNFTSNFHLWFLSALGRYIGFPPGNDWEEGMWFDMKDGTFQTIRPLHDYVMDSEKSRIFYSFLKNTQFGEGIPMTGNQRSIMLQTIIEYYSLHLEGVKKIESVEILKQVF